MNPLQPFRVDINVTGGGEFVPGGERNSSQLLIGSNRGDNPIITLVNHNDYEVPVKVRCEALFHSHKIVSFHEQPCHLCTSGVAHDIDPGTDCPISHCHPRGRTGTTSHSNGSAQIPSNLLQRGTRSWAGPSCCHTHWASLSVNGQILVSRLFPSIHGLARVSLLACR